MRIWEKYQGAVIWRTEHSKDYLGKSITGLEPFREHMYMFPLNEHEYEAVERAAKEAMGRGKIVQRFASEVSEKIWQIFLERAS